MSEVLSEVLNTPATKLFLVAGFFFLAVSVLGKISGKVDPGRTGRIISGVLGVAFLALAFVMPREHTTVRPQPKPSPEQPAPAFDLTGEWRLVNTVEKTTYRPFKGLRLGYRVFLTQTGNEVIGQGEKVWENGKSLPTKGRSPIRLEGKIDGRKVVATFVEEGERRKTSGRFDWVFLPEQDKLFGEFTHTAANASGQSTAARIE
ncbi:MAG: hypothetical protein D6743_13705 [Calditrichaeota bacterium]|nr:MAG: hypothetical protein D6743_13705 [Calditrichota bacterium]